MATFLLKTEPTTFSFDRLLADKRCTWDGVTSAAALGHLRKIRAGDQLLIYHTGNEKAIVGSATCTKGAYEDPAAPGRNDRDEPKTPVIDLKPHKRAKSPATLTTIRADPRFKEFALVRQSRLSVMEVPAPLAAIIRGWTGL